MTKKNEGPARPLSPSAHTVAPTRRMRWRRAERTWVTAAERYELRLDDALMAVVQACPGGFFWYVVSRDIEARNTADSPQDLGPAKLEAAAWCRTRRLEVPRG